MTLTFDLLTQKSIGHVYSIIPNRWWILMMLGLMDLKLLSRNNFQRSGRCDLDLWPTDLKNNRAYLLNNTKLLMKSDDSWSYGSQVIERKQFSKVGSLWPWPLTYLSQKQLDTSIQWYQSAYEVWRLWVIQISSYWSATIFKGRVTVTLTFDLLTQIW